jgi:hypothetical protein
LQQNTSLKKLEKGSVHSDFRLSTFDSRPLTPDC